VIPARRLYVSAAAFALSAVACAVVAFLRRHSLGDAVAGIEGAYFNRSVGAPAYAGVFSSWENGTVFDPFHPLNADLWLGAALAFALVAAVLAAVTRRAPVIPARSSYVAALAFVGATLGCLVVTLVRRHSLADNVGAVVHGNAFDPFHPLNAYLWLGAAMAFALTALVVLVLARFSRTDVFDGDATQARPQHSV
jgi:hypothetical protein